MKRKAQQTCSHRHDRARNIQERVGSTTPFFHTMIWPSAGRRKSGRNHRARVLDISGAADAGGDLRKHHAAGCGSDVCIAATRRMAPSHAWRAHRTPIATVEPP